MSLQRIRPVIILGCQRSGTTLLGQILGAHPDAVLIDEEDGATNLLQQACVDGELHARILAPALEEARAKYKDSKRILADGSLAGHVTHVVIKAPNLTYSVDPLVRLVGDPVFLFAVRDIRDVVCSMARLPHAPMIANQLRRMRESPSTVERFAPEIRRLQDESLAPAIKRAIIWRVKTAHHARFEAPPGNALLVRYECLVAEPVKWLRTLFEHAGLDPARAAHHEDVMRGMGPGFTMRGRPIDIASIQRWRRSLSEDEESAVWNEAQGLMDELGYTRFPQAPLTVSSIDTDTLESPIIATGRGGSGTRLLSLMLQKLGVFLGNQLNNSADSIEWVDLLYEMAVKSVHEPAHHSPRQDWGTELRARAAAVLPNGGWSPGQPWGWKLPESMLVLPELARALPASKVIHLVRNPLDTCLRRTHMTSRTDNPVGRATLARAYFLLEWDRDPAADPDHLRNAASWWLQVGAVQQLAQRLGPRCLELRYEDLCSQPHDVAIRTASFLGVAPPRAMTVPVDETRRRRWESGDPRIADVWAVCGDIATRYGYARPDDHQ